MPDGASLRFRRREGLPAPAETGGFGAIELNTLSLILTLRCNFECRHCLYRCNPGRTETMSDELAEAAISAAQRTSPGMVMVCFTGGEPFLVRRSLSRLVEYCSDRGLYSGVVTNAYWATSESSAHRALEPLCERGLADLTTSLDDFHADFVKAERIRNAVVAARAFGMRVHVNVCVTAGSALRGDDVPDLLELDRELFSGPGAVEVCEFVPVRVGYARDRIGEEEFATGAHPDNYAQPCLAAIRNPTVAPDGTVYACCGAGGATDHGPAELLRSGNLTREPFAAVFARMQSNLAFNLIAEAGPFALVELARSVAPDVPERRSLGSICDVCQELTENDALRAAVGVALGGLSREDGSPPHGEERQ